ncbi:MAG TPA: hypothetical protein VF559_03690 [Caulobacteraceae bacterium]|jgi:hypothetical protein
MSRLALAAAALALLGGTARAQTAPTLASLTGADEGVVKGALGVPDIARAEGQGALWTYRFPGCALLVFFRQSGRALRVSGASASDRRTGTAVEVNACLAQGAAAAQGRDTGQTAIDALLAPADPGR